MKKYYVLLFIIQSLLCINDEFIGSLKSNTQLQRVDYSNIKGRFHVRIKMGEPPQLLFITIDINNEFSWLSNLPITFNTSVRKIRGKDNPLLKGQQCKGETYIDNFQFLSEVPLKDSLYTYGDSFYLTGLMFYYLSDAPSKESPCIALPYQHIDPSFSITDVLYSNKKIDKKVFSFITLSSNLKGKIIFGDISNDNILKREYYKGECKISNNKWGCSLDMINIKTNNHTQFSYSINKSFSFTTLRDEIIVPLSFFNDMVHYLDSIPMYNKECRILYIHHYKRIECNPQVEPFILSLGIQRKTLIMENFFQKENGYIYPKIKYIDDNEEWIIGTLFFENFITSFNYEDGNIVYYSKTEINSDNNNELMMIKILMISNIILLFFILIINIIILMNNPLKI